MAKLVLFKDGKEIGWIAGQPNDRKVIKYSLCDAYIRTKTIIYEGDSQEEIHYEYAGMIWNIEWKSLYGGEE